MREKEAQMMAHAAQMNKVGLTSGFACGFRRSGFVSSVQEVHV